MSEASEASKRLPPSSPFAGDDGSVDEVEIPQDLVDDFGRLRAARTAPDGALYVTTSNGEDDKVLRINPES